MLTSEVHHCYTHFLDTIHRSREDMRMQALWVIYMVLGNFRNTSQTQTLRQKRLVYENVLNNIYLSYLQFTKGQHINDVVQ